jgi:hypothetical protein
LHEHFYQKPRFPILFRASLPKGGFSMIRTAFLATLALALLGSATATRGDEPASGTVPVVAPAIPAADGATVVPVRWYRGYRYAGYYYSYPGYGYGWYGSYYPGYYPGYYYGTPYSAARPYYYGPYRGFRYYGPRAGFGVYY